MNEKQEEGKLGEVEATKYLENMGYKIICNNFRCLAGEIDIIAKDDDEIVFVEVKTRKSNNYGEPKEAVNKKKLEHIFKASRYFLYKNNLQDKYIRIDVIEVYIKNQGIRINHLKQVV